MKKFFGTVFLIIGLVMMIFGIAAITNVQTRNSTFDGQITSALNEEYRAESAIEHIAGIAAAAGGLVLFTIGLVMLVTKTNAQRRKEAELAQLKRMQQPTVAHQTAPPHTHTHDDVYTQLEKLGKLKEKGLITEEEFQKQKNRILG